jgi:hypothetical protein
VLPRWSGSRAACPFRRRGTVSEAMLYAFDLLEIDGEDFRSLPLGDRKKPLANLARRAPGCCPVLFFLTLSAEWSPPCQRITRSSALSSTRTMISSISVRTIRFLVSGVSYRSAPSVISRSRSAGVSSVAGEAVSPSSSASRLRTMDSRSFHRFSQRWCPVPERPPSRSRARRRYGKLRRDLGSSPLDVDEQFAPLLETAGGLSAQARQPRDREQACPCLRHRWQKPPKEPGLTTQVPSRIKPGP